MDYFRLIKDKFVTQNEKKTPKDKFCKIYTLT